MKVWRVIAGGFAALMLFSIALVSVASGEALVGQSELAPETGVLPPLDGVTVYRIAFGWEVEPPQPLVTTVTTAEVAPAPPLLEYWQMRRRPAMRAPALVEMPADDLEPWMVGDIDGALFENERQALVETPADPPPALPGLAEFGNSVINGEVYDFSTIEPIEGAAISLAGRPENVRTDAQGRFRIEGLPVGSFALRVDKLGYSIGRQTVATSPTIPIEVRVGIRVRSQAESDETILEEEPVIGEYTESNSGDFSLDLTAAATLTSGISAEDFSEQGITDAGDAVSQIAGANIVGGRYAVVRGLGDRYSNTLLNNALISSADPSRKAVQLDLFPSELLQAVEIQKTFLPNRTAEWAGGLVRITTLRLPEERLLKVKIGTSFDDDIADLDEFYVVPDSDLGALGLNVPGLLTNDFGRQFSSLPLRARQEILQESQGVRPFIDSPEQELEFALTYGETFELTDNVRLGAVLSFNRERKDEAEIGEVINREFNPASRIFRRKRTLDTYDRTLNWGLLGSLSLELGEHHTIGASYFRYHDARDRVVRSRGEQTETAPGVNARTFISSNPAREGNAPFFGDAAFVSRGFDAIQPLRRDLDALQFFGEHRFGDDPERATIFQWSFSSSNSEEIRPQDTRLNLFEIDFADPAIQDQPDFVERTFDFSVFPPIITTISGPEQYNPSRGVVETFGDIGGEGIAGTIPHLFRESLQTTENTRYLDLGLTHPIYLKDGSDDRFEIAFGGSGLRKNRKTRGERYGLFSSGQNYNNPVLVFRDRGQFGIDQLDIINGVERPDGQPLFNDTQQQPQNSVYYSRLTTDRTTKRNIDSGTDLHALYLMGSYYKGPTTVIAGVRFEQETRSYEILEPGVLNFLAPNEAQFGNETNSHLAPALTVTHRFGKNEAHMVSASWSETIARPTFFEFAPLFTEDQASGDLRAGNPNLRDSTIQNFDISWAYTSPEGNRLGVNLFRKDVQDPIVKAFSTLSLGSDSSGAVLTYENADQGVLQGIELEGNLQLNDRWNVYTNYTFLDSQLEIDLGQETTEIGYEGQPEHIFNLALGYTDEDLGYSANLIYNYTGEYLAIVPRAITDDVVNQEARQSLDFVLRKNLTLMGSAGVLSLRVTNLLDEPVRQVLRPSGRTYEEANPGRGYSLSYTTEF